MMYVVGSLILIIIIIFVLMGREIDTLHKEADMRERKHMETVRQLDARYEIRLESAKYGLNQTINKLTKDHDQLLALHTEFERRALDIAGHGERLIELMQSNRNTVVEEHEVMTRFTESVDKLEELIKP